MLTRAKTHIVSGRRAECERRLECADRAGSRDKLRPRFCAAVRARARARQRLAAHFRSRWLIVAAVSVVHASPAIVAAANANFRISEQTAAARYLRAHADGRHSSRRRRIGRSRSAPCLIISCRVMADARKPAASPDFRCLAARTLLSHDTRIAHHQNEQSAAFIAAAALSYSSVLQCANAQQFFISCNHCCHASSCLQNARQQSKRRATNLRHFLFAPKLRYGRAKLNAQTNFAYRAVAD